MKDTDILHQMTLEDKDNKSLGKYNKHDQSRNQNVSLDDHEFWAGENKRMAKVSYSRWGPLIERGYDPVFNSPSKSLQTVSRPATMWDKLQATNDHYGDAKLGRDLSGLNKSKLNNASTLALTTVGHYEPRATTAPANHHHQNRGLTSTAKQGVAMVPPLNIKGGVNQGHPSDTLVFIKPPKSAATTTRQSAVRTGGFAGTNV